MRKHHRWLLAVLVLLSGALTWMILSEGHRDFDPALWKGDTLLTVDAPTMRQRMVDDLQASHPLVGLARDSVVALLGEPLDTPYFRDWLLVYWLGPERGMISVDSEWLVLKTDTAGVVTRVAVVTD
jgi:hypothetical protein